MNYITVSGVLSILFIYFICGTFFAEKFNFKNSYNLYLFNIGVSLYISWFFVFLLNIIKPDLYNISINYMFIVLFLICIFKIIFSKKNKFHELFFRFNSNIFIYFILYMFFIFFLASVNNFDPIFIDWDSLMSWNQWAIDLSNNNWPSDGLRYPVLFSGLWSLIYRIQGNNEIWIFAKFSLFFLYIILFLFLMGINKSVHSNIFVSFFCIYNFIILRNYEMLSGMMDMVVSLFLFISLYYLNLINSLNKNKQYLEKYKEYYFLTIIFGSLCPLIKHVGTISIILITLQLISDFFTKKINFIFFIISLIFLLIPTSLLFSMYGFEVNQKHFDLIEYIYKYTLSLSSDELRVVKSFKVIFHDLLLRGIVPILFYFIIILISILNLMKVKDNILGCFYFLIAFFNFILFSYMAAYDYRNSLSIIIFFGLSASLYLEKLNNKN